MKKIIFFYLFALLTVVFSCSVKQRITNVNMQKEIVFPVFLDSVKFQADLIKTREIEKLYLDLKDRGWPYIYKYYFTVSKEGKIKGEYKYLDKDVSVRALNGHFINTLDKYRWMPGYEQGCQACKVICYGVINISFKVPRNEVELEISIFDGTVSENPQNKTIYKNAIVF